MAANRQLSIAMDQEGADLISRSQAKRVLSRFDHFQEVLLDFKGVNSIGQAFADEIFRVFKRSHPEVRVIAINISPDIARMIRRATSSLSEPSTLESFKAEN